MRQRRPAAPTAGRGPRTLLDRRRPHHALAEGVKAKRVWLPLLQRLRLAAVAPLHKLNAGRRLLLLVRTIAVSMHAVDHCSAAAGALPLIVLLLLLLAGVRPGHQHRRLEAASAAAALLALTPVATGHNIAESFLTMTQHTLL